VTRALLLGAAVALAGGSVACDGRCHTSFTESTFELAQDELDVACEDICAEAIDDGSTFEGCSRTDASVDPPMVTCTFSLETCDSGGGF
jgi:hypothetical protein